MQNIGHSVHGPPAKVDITDTSFEQVDPLQKRFKGGMLAKDSVPTMNAVPVAGIVRLIPPSSFKLCVLVLYTNAPAQRKSKVLTTAWFST